jgi:hypothetical protein
MFKNLPLLKISEDKLVFKEVNTGRYIEYYIKKDFETSKIFEK